MNERGKKRYLIGVSVMTISTFVAIGGAAAQTTPCPGTESRPVFCRDFRGNVVSDSYCMRVGAKPRGTRGCTAQCQTPTGGSGSGGGCISCSNSGDGDGNDPLIFDLEGDGIRLLSPDDSNVMFDMDNDGVADRTGWVDGTDGILTLDENGNGIIDNQSEMFGNEENLAFKHLAEYDSNDDGRIDSEDRVWKHLSMWVDANTNGRTDAGELKTMADIGMQKIDLDYDTVDEIHAGNQVTGFGSFVRQVGQQGRRIVSTVMEALFNFISG